MVSNICSSLKKRELGFPVKDQLKIKAAHQAVSNIAKDQFKRMKISFPINDPFSAKSAHLGPLLAVSRFNHLSLWDLFSGTRLWDLDTTSTPPSFALKKLEVDQKGTVVQLFEVDAQSQTVNVFQKGVKSATIYCPQQAADCQFIQGQIVGIGVNPNLSKENLSLYIWDLSGKLVDTKVFYGWSKEDKIRFTANEHWLVVSSTTYSKILLMDRISRQIRTLQLGDDSTRFVGSMTFQGNQLLIDTYEWKSDLFVDIRNPEIVVLDLLKGKIHSQYLLEKTEGSVKNLMIHKGVAYYLIDYVKPENSIWSLNLSSGLQQRVYTPRTSGDVQLSIMGNCLTLCFTDDLQRVQKRVVIDTSSGKIVNESLYASRAPMSFQEGFLQVPRLCGNEIYVENFHLPPNDSQEKVLNHLV